MTHVETLVSARDLVKRFPARGGRRREAITAVGGVSLDIEAGSTLGLVGESGSGKSTLGRLLLRLVQPDSGSLSFEGLPLQGLRPRQLRRLRPRMQIVLQNPYSALNPRLVVREIVDFNLGPLGLARAERRERVREAIRLVGLGGEILDRYPHQLSGGQAQRVGLARALVSRPRFIVADEIVSALDVSVQAEILTLLMDLRSRFKLTTLFISHNLHVVRSVSDRVGVMFAGRIVEAGSVVDLYEDARHPYTRLLLASAPGTGERQASLREREQLRVQLRTELTAFGSLSKLVEVAPGHLVESPEPGDHPNNDPGKDDLGKDDPGQNDRNRAKGGHVSEDVTVEMVRRLADAANLRIPEEDLPLVATALSAYRTAFAPLERLDLTGVDPVVTMDPRWDR